VKKKWGEQRESKEKITSFAPISLSGLLRTMNESVVWLTFPFQGTEG